MGAKTKRDGEIKISREREGATSLSAGGADEYWRRRLRWGGGGGERWREWDRSWGNMLLCYVLMGTVIAGEKKVNQEARVASTYQTDTHIHTETCWHTRTMFHLNMDTKRRQSACTHTVYTLMQVGLLKVMVKKIGFVTTSFYSFVGTLPTWL